MVQPVLPSLTIGLTTGTRLISCGPGAVTITRPISRAFRRVTGLTISGTSNIRQGITESTGVSRSTSTMIVQMDL